MNPVTEYIQALLASPHFAGQVAHHRCVAAQAAVFGTLHRPLPKAVELLLQQRGLAALYSHQVAAMDRIRAGQSVVVATPTASGKSLIYNIPVVEHCLRDPDARALYLFPLKALAQDQRAAFESLVSPWPKDARPRIAIYDGDTSDHFRRKIRQDPPSVLITTPEMLHLAILPFHEQWTSFLAGLTHVVVDEAHTYRGVLGAHMAQIFRRLNRIAERYGSRPEYIFCTATVGNPAELAGKLAGREDAQAPKAVLQSGAPQGARHFVFINPEHSPATAAIDLLKAALARGLRTIVYCRSRRMTELISVWAAGQPGAKDSDGLPHKWRSRISAYRAGFLPEERRDIEARMSDGTLLAVITTSALELGIDIGGLDVCILVGYPGTVMSTLQRGGRVGRAQQESAVILVAGEDALDQYFMRYPNDFFNRPAEQAVVNPDNAVIVKRHLECAAAELSLSTSEPWLHSFVVQECLQELEREGLLLRTAEGKHYVAARKRPQRHVDLRGCGQTFTIEDNEGQVLGTVDGLRAYRETHPGAVYLHRGQSYVITDLDSSTATVKAQLSRVNYYTRVRSQKSTEILACYASKSLQPANKPAQQSAESSPCIASLGRLRITETITGYEKRSTAGNRLLHVVPLDFPPHVFETEGLWYTIPDAARVEIEDQFLHFMGAIHAIEHAAIGMLPLTVMADRNDFGGISTPMHGQLALPAVFIYDGLPGGAGLCRAAFEQAFAILEVTLKTIAECPCEDGCPSCVHSPKCGSGNRPISKQGAQALLQILLSNTSTSTSISPQTIAPLTMPMQESHSSHLSPNPQSRDRGLMPLAEDFGEAAPSPLPFSHPPKNYMVLDVETRRSAAEVGGWHRADRMGVSVAVLYDAAEDRYFSYTQDQLGEMFARLRGAAVVVGFNSARFDYAVLQPFAPYAVKDLPTVDMLERIKERLSYRVSLDNVAQATLDAHKSADGLQALRWWAEGNTEAIQEYCQKDVDISRRVYVHGLEKGYVLFSNKAGQKVRAQVDFNLR